MTEDETTTEQLAEIEQQADPVQVREGRWRTRNGLVKDVTAMPTDHEDYAAAYPWWDGVSTWRNDGRWLAGGSTMDLVTYLGPIEQQPESQPEPQPNAAAIEELRSEVSYVQRLLGESRQRVTQLEELVASLRTINEAQEKAVEAAGKENTALRLQVENRQQEYERQKGRIEFLETLNAGNGAAIGDYIAKVAKLQGLVDTARGQLEAAATEHDILSTQLAAVKAELASVAADRQQLRIELDAAQQVPPAIVDRFKEGWNQGTARAIETVLEWLQPIRAVDNEHLANETLQHLPQIMRTLTGLHSHAID